MRRGLDADALRYELQRMFRQEQRTGFFSRLFRRQDLAKDQPKERA
jgi:hypothetical protein